jgi:hypothetical protein
MEGILLQEITSRLSSGIARTVPLVGSDDKEELLQDGLAIAIGIIRRAEDSGKKFTAGSVAYYTLKYLRSGRRSTYQGMTEPLHPATQIAGRSRLCSLDEPIADQNAFGEPTTLGEMLASKQDDPATAAARRLDWDDLVQRLDEVAKEILCALGGGTNLTLLVSPLRRSRSSIQADKERLANTIKEHLGEDILRQVQERPRWHYNISSIREELACRWYRNVV